MRYPILKTEETKDCFLIHIRDRKAISISKDLYFSKSIYELEDLSEQEIIGLEKNQAFHEALAASIKFLGSSLKPEKRLRNHLAGRNHPSEAIDASVAALKSEDRLNDSRYASRFIHQKMKRTPVSKGLMMELLSREGIPEEVSGEAIGKSMMDEHRDAVRVFRMKSKGSMEKGYKALLSRGYDPEMSYEIAKKESSE
ncbi:MAG: RecX family transcriptional regulator [Clostridia bacterium]